MGGSEGSKKTEPGACLIFTSLVARAAARAERQRPSLAAGRGATSKADGDVMAPRAPRARD